MKLFQALTLTLTISSLALAQQEMQVNLQYPAGTQLKNSYFGVQFTVPSGWIAQFAEEGGVQALALGHPDGYAAVLVFQHGLSAANYQQALSKPFPFDNVTFQPSAPAKQQGNLVSVFGQEPSSGGEAQIGAVLGQTGSSVLMLVIGAAGSSDFTIQGFKQMQNNLRFVAPLAAQGATNLRQTWQNRLAGRLLASSNTSTSSSQNGLGATNSSTRLLLCRDGRYGFETTSQASVSAGDFSALSKDGSSSEGTWKLEFVNQNGAILALTENAQQRRVNVRLAGNNLLLDGRAVNVNAGGC